ncbi:hypothetical protein N0V94_007028 [Neodidymelliopsis sp. IMI 364377]|nr:hypothetical protein N0V94_007028 [Neodidymelliopsis sp. IMI 364377]
MALSLSEDPTSLSPVVGSALAIGVAYIIFSIFKPLFSPLRSVPRPFLARYTQLWESWAILRKDWVKYNIELHERYGPVVRIAPNRYSIDDADAIKTILGFENKFDKATFYSAFDGEEGASLFSEKSTQVHSKMRRPIGALYTTTNLLSYEPFVEASNKLLIQRLNEKADDGSVLDLPALIFGFLDDNCDKWGIITAIHDFLHFTVNLAIIPELHPWFMRLTALMGQKSNVSRLTDFSEKQINDRVSGATKPGEGRDFVDRLLELESKGKATRKDTFVACSSNIGAGSDTTAITISVMLALLYSHPDKLAALRKEIEDDKCKADANHLIRSRW